ncbi:MAG: Response regulator receiver protein [Gemmatimonadetes bacterium]|nr:Response regulator receiver protein [Gemmatimonadota bacterium]
MQFAMQGAFGSSAAAGAVERDWSIPAGGAGGARGSEAQARPERASPDAPARRLVAVADDDPTIAMALEVWLEHLGYEPRVFSSCDALLRWTQTDAPPVAAFVLDVQMEGRGGPETCLEIKRIPAYSATPAVLVSSIPAGELSASAQEVGSSWVSKDGRMLGNLAACLARVVR